MREKPQTTLSKGVKPIQWGGEGLDGINLNHFKANMNERRIISPNSLNLACLWVKVCSFSCEYKFDDYLNLLWTDGLYNKNKIKNILAFQLSFGNQENFKEAVIGKTTCQENIWGNLL